MEYYSIHDTAQKIGVTVVTLRNWEKSGKLVPAYRSPGNIRYYSEDQINKVLGIKHKKIVVGYCRVSTKKQKDNLERQEDAMKSYLIAQGKPFKIITDIGSGINYNKKGLKELIEMICKNEVEKVVVLYKDRLLRFGFELVEYVASLHGCKIEVIDNTEKTEQEELVKDLVQIIKVFDYKLQGEKADKVKKIVAELKNKEND